MFLPSKFSSVFRPYAKAFFSYVVQSVRLVQNRNRFLFLQAEFCQLVHFFSFLRRVNWFIVRSSRRLPHMGQAQQQNHESRPTSLSAHATNIQQSLKKKKIQHPPLPSRPRTGDVLGLAPVPAPTTPTNRVRPPPAAGRHHRHQCLHATRQHTAGRPLAHAAAVDSPRRSSPSSSLA